HDGAAPDPRTPGSGAAAVVIAPGPPLARWAGFEQRRACATLPCLASQYLDAAPSGEDNAGFVDRNDAQRALNRDGFIAGPVSDAAGQVRVNDRIAAIAYADVVPRIMARVALEAGHCLALAAARADGCDALLLRCGAEGCTQVQQGSGLDVGIALR